MYEVYVSERPGRPRLAVALAAGLLLLTIGLAAGLIRHKQRAARVPLGASQRIGEWNFAVCPPDGWKRETPGEAPGEVGAIFREPGGSERTVAVLRGPFVGMPAPATYGATSFDDTVLWLTEAQTAKRASAEPAVFGSLPGVAMQWIAMRKRRTIEPVLGIVGVAPDGRVYGLLLRCPGALRRADEQLLRRLGEAVQFPGLEVTTDLNAAAATTGLRMQAPAGVRGSAVPCGPLRTLQLFSDPTGEKPWAMGISPMMIAPGRTAKAILADIVRNMTEDPNLADTVEAVKLREREAYRVRFDARQFPWDGEMWVVPLDAGRAVVLDGRDDGPDSDLESVCRTIAETIRAVEPVAVDLAAAERRGVELLAEIRSKRLDAWFDEWVGADQEFTIERAGKVEGYYRLRYSRPREARGGRWRVESEVRRSLSDGHTLTYKREARVDHDGVGYELAEARRVDPPAVRPRIRLLAAFRYEEHRAAAGDRVQKTLRIEQDQHSGAFRVGPGFACDPVLQIVYWLAATDSQKRPVLVSTTDRFEAEILTQLIRPLGPQPVPDSRPERSVPAVFVQSDSAVDGYTIYFDGDGRMLYVDFGANGVFRRSGEGEADDVLPLPSGTPSSPRVAR